MLGLGNYTEGSIVNDQMIQHELTSDELLKVLFEFSAQIAEERQLDHLLVLMADLGKKLVTCDRCTLWLLDERNHQVWSRVAHGVDALRMDMDAGMVGECIRRQGTIIMNDPYHDEHFNPEIDRKTGYTTTSMLAVPIFNREHEVMGVFQAINKLTEEQNFLENDVERLKLAASFSGKSLESAVLNQEVEETQNELVYILGEVGESRSKETGFHVKRVGEYSYLMGKLYGMTESEAEDLRLSAPLHDIGKVGIPDAILQKPGKLTDEEFDIMKTHAINGERLLTKSPRRILQFAAKISGEHHEKWNGRGYPRGKVGEEIDLFARIVAIADVFDALAHKRCYKDAWSLDKIKTLFQEEKGCHFDPKLTDLFLEHFDDFVAIKDKYQD